MVEVTTPLGIVIRCRDAHEASRVAAWVRWMRDAQTQRDMAAAVRRASVSPSVRGSSSWNARDDRHAADWARRGVSAARAGGLPRAWRWDTRSASAGAPAEGWLGDGVLGLSALSSPRDGEVA